MKLFRFRRRFEPLMLISTSFVVVECYVLILGLEICVLVIDVAILFLAGFSEQLVLLLIIFSVLQYFTPRIYVYLLYFYCCYFVFPLKWKLNKPVYLKPLAPSRSVFASFHPLLSSLSNSLF